MPLNFLLPVRKATIISILSLSVAFCGGAHGADDSEEEFVPLQRLDELIPSLKEQLAQASNLSNTMQNEASQLDYQKAAALRSSSRKGTHIRFSASGGYQVEDSAGISSEALKYRYNFSATRPLYHWGAVTAEHEYGQVNLERAKEDYQVGFLNFYSVVNQRFVDLVAARQALKVREADYERGAFEVSIVREQVKNKDVVESVLTARELNLRLAKLELESRRLRFEDSLNDFRQLIGLSPDAPFELPDGLPPVASSLEELASRVDAFIADIDERSSELQMLARDVDMVRKRLVVENARNKPKVDFLVSASRDSETISTGDRRDLERDRLFGGISVNWNVFDSGDSKGAVIQTREAIRQRELTLERRRKQMVAELTTQMDLLKAYQEQSQLMATQVKWTVGAYKAAQRDVEEGRQAESVLLDVVKQLEAERSQLVSHQANYYKTLASILSDLEDPAILAYLSEK